MHNDVRVEGRDVEAWGLPARPPMNTRMQQGRWYGDADVRDRAKVAVLAPTLARTTGKGIGDRVVLRTSNRPVGLRVIGVSGNQADNGSVVFTPVTTLQTVLGRPGRSTATGSRRPPLIALAGTVVLALLVMLAPLRRAVRFRPGEAIRHA